MQSEFLTLGKSDFIKGLALVVIVAVLGSLQQGLTTFGFDFASYNWAEIIKVAVTAGVGYLGKNLLTTSDGKLLGKIG